jgi:TDG/mug DNA glycosylase family protein
MILPDHLAPGLDVIIVGTAVAERSAARGHYYAGPGNDFWHLLHESGLTPRLLTPDDDGTLLSLGIGLTDLVKNVARSHDRGLKFDVPSLNSKVELYQPRWVAFHGVIAAKEYAKGIGHRPPGLGRAPFLASGRPVFVLPSASGSNHRRDYHGRPTRISWWAEFAALVREEVA